jgi:hypothetical protein
MLRCNKNQYYLIFKCSLIDSIMYFAISYFHSQYKPRINPIKNNVIYLAVVGIPVEETNGFSANAM